MIFSVCFWRSWYSVCGDPEVVRMTVSMQLWTRGSLGVGMLQKFSSLAWDFINITASSLLLLKYLHFSWRHPAGCPRGTGGNVLTFWQHRVHGCTCTFASVCTTGMYTCACSLCAWVCCGNTGQTPGLARQSKWWISQVVEVYIALLSGCHEEIQSPMGQLKEYLVTKYGLVAVQLASFLHPENIFQNILDKLSGRNQCCVFPPGSA